MDEEIQQPMMKAFHKRKMQPDFQSHDFDNQGELSSPLSLMNKFMGEKNEGMKDSRDIGPHIRRRSQTFQREPLLMEFLELVWKILKLKPTEKNNLRHVLDDIKTLGLNILDLEPHALVVHTIVTEALEVPEKNYSGLGKEGTGLVEVEPNPQRGFNQEFIDWLVKRVVEHLYPNSKPGMFLEGNFGPIKEETDPTSNLKIIGEIPLELNGMMVRNGPNPQHDPVAKYGWLDGDSMLHAIHFHEGKATYVSRYVQTSRYKQEKFFGDAQFVKFGDLTGQFGVFMAAVQLLKAKLGVVDMSYGWLNGDTGVVYHGNMLMALQDWEEPYVVNVSEDGDLVTVGIYEYGPHRPHSFLPHPKKDPITGEMFFLGVSNKAPYVTYNHVTESGSVSKGVPITTSGPTYMHDFGLTKNYVIFMDLPFCFDPEYMANDEKNHIHSYVKKSARFGILPRYATNEDKIEWFEFEKTMFIFHNANAWEEDDGNLVLAGCVLEPKDPREVFIRTRSGMGSGLKSGESTGYSGPGTGVSVSTGATGDSVRTRSRIDSFTPAQVYTGPPVHLDFTPAHLYTGPGPDRSTPSNDSHEMVRVRSNISGSTKEKEAEKPKPLDLPTLYKFTFNLRTKKGRYDQLTLTKGDYPKINESYIGRKSRYVYISEFNGAALIPSIVKMDLQWKTELKLDFVGKFGSEVAFTPYARSLQEDHGYLTTFVHDEYFGLSYVYVIDALQMQILAMIELPNRVPYGFHSIFMTEEEIQSQMRTLT